MSIAQDQAERTEAEGWRDRERPAEPAASPEVQTGFGPLGLLIGTVGGLVTGALLVAAASLVSPGPGTQELQRVASVDLETASQSLDAGRAAALVDEAKACRRPLGFLVIQATGKAVGTIRVRSGAYVSPHLRLGPQAERIAVPFPAPVEAGHGQIILENNSDGADVFLMPGIRVGAGPTTRAVDVRWDPKAPC